MHCSLVNQSWAPKDLLKIRGRREFVGKQVIENHGKLNFQPELPLETIEVAKRFNYDQKTGKYLSEYTIFGF